MNEAVIQVLIAAEPDMRSGLSSLLRREGMRVQEAEEAAAVFALIRRRAPDVLLLDARIGNGKALEILRRVRRLVSGLAVVVVAALPNLGEAIEAVKAGACDYLPDPLNAGKVATVIRSALTGRGRPPSARSGGEEAEDKYSLAQQMGGSEKVRRLALEIARVAPTNFSVVITGETGSGKEVVARAIRAQSHRAGCPFVAVDCGAIPDSLIENELFGHERGSFTGADRAKIGKFEAASGGTLFLDEIANLPIGMQSKLLRVLQEKQVYRIGNMLGVNVDVRVIAATNQDLGALVAAKTFRGDLFHRLSEYVLLVPCLRERREDIIFLAQRFLDSTNRELGKQVRGFSEAALQLMLPYDWPGNVRELQNVIRGAVLLADEMVGVEQLRLRPAAAAMPPLFAGEPAGPDYDSEVLLSLKEIVQLNTIQVERAVLRRVLERTGGNKAKAARILRIDYKTIHSKIRQYGI